MRIFKLLGVALLAVFAFGALVAASASAVTFLLAEWLVNGVAVTTELLTEASGELLLEDTNIPLLGKAKVLCSGSLDGWVGPNSLDWISEVLTLTGGAVNTIELNAEGLVCINQENCGEPLVWAVHLGWETEVELMEDTGTFFVNLILPHANGANPGWEVECMNTIIGPVTDTCTAPEAVSELTLEGTTLLALFSEAITELAGAKLATCTQSNAESGIVEGEGTITLSEGGELTASSETAVS